MKHSVMIALALAASLVLGGAPAAERVGAAGDGQLTAAAAGVFPAGTTYLGVALQSSTFGLGVLVHADGSAEGEVEVVLLGASALGLPQAITLQGPASSGAPAAGGGLTVSGTGQLDLGNGLPPTSVPYILTATPSGLQLTIGATALPTQTLSAGSITIL
jgi:hypothetical protein